MVADSQRGQSVIEFIMFTLALVSFVVGIAALSVQATQAQEAYRFTNHRRTP